MRRIRVASAPVDVPREAARGVIWAGPKIVARIGYLSYTGDLDTCIHIRTVVVADGRAHVQAGGGTVADAKPEYEYEESVAKARGVKNAIELAATQPDWP